MEYLLKMGYKKELEEALIASSGVKREAARTLGWAWSTFKNRLAKHPDLIESYANNLVRDPIKHEAYLINDSDPSINGLSTYYDYVDDETGERKRGWIKTKRQRQNDVLIKNAILALADSSPRIVNIKEPKFVEQEFIAVYPTTDHHFGQYSYHLEVGEDYDLNIAQDVLESSYYDLVNRSMKAETAIIKFIGDILHYDSLEAKTPTHGYLLDSDSRYSKMVSVTIETIRNIITLVLSKHKAVKIMVLAGNHDPASTVWLRRLIAVACEKNPRVTIIGSEAPYFADSYGKCFIGGMHGNFKKISDGLGLLYATRFRKQWGETEHAVVFSGHFHCEKKIEHAGITFWQLQTLAANDAHSYNSGYDSKRGALSIIYHKEHGEYAVNRFTPDMAK